MTNLVKANFNNLSVKDKPRDKNHSQLKATALK